MSVRQPKNPISRTSVSLYDMEERRLVGIRAAARYRYRGRTGTIVGILRDYGPSANELPATDTKRNGGKKARWRSISPTVSELALLDGYAEARGWSRSRAVRALISKVHQDLTTGVPERERP